MKQRTVGIRELKAQLSGYIQDVKRGETIVITERGKPVGRITPVRESVDERIQNIVRSGVAAWSGKKLQPGKPVVKLRRGSKLISDLVAENRD